MSVLPTGEASSARTIMPSWGTRPEWAASSPSDAVALTISSGSAVVLGIPFRANHCDATIIRHAACGKRAPA